MVVTLGLLGLALALLGLYAAAPDSAQAAGIPAPQGEITVCLAGPPDCQYDSIQAAVLSAKLRQQLVGQLQNVTAPLP